MSLVQKGHRELTVQRQRRHRRARAGLGSGSPDDAARTGGSSAAGGRPSRDDVGPGRVPVRCRTQRRGGRRTGHRGGARHERPARRGGRTNRSQGRGPRRRVGSSDRRTGVAPPAGIPNRDAPYRPAGTTSGRARHPRPPREGRSCRGRQLGAPPARGAEGPGEGGSGRGDRGPSPPARDGSAPQGVGDRALVGCAVGQRARAGHGATGHRLRGQRRTGGAGQCRRRRGHTRRSRADANP